MCLEWIVHRVQPRGLPSYAHVGTRSGTVQPRRRRVREVIVEQPVR